MTRMHCASSSKLRLYMDAVGPEVHVALRGEIALVPSPVLVDPDLLQPRDRRGRQTGGILAEQSRQRLLEVAGRDALQVEDRNEHLQALRAPGVGWQDRGSEVDALRIVGSGPRSRTRGWRTATGPMPVMTSRSGRWPCRTDAPVAVLGLEVGMRAEKSGDLGLDRLSQQARVPHCASTSVS